ncbi:MAG TPA: gluconokinase [Candidatus Dormibacteraeota bacterium]
MVLAVDVGTSSVRAVAYDSDLTPVPGLESHLPHTPRTARDGTAELDIRPLTRRVIEAVDRVVEAARGAEIEAVGISSFWHGLAATDSSLRPLTPAFLWFDGRAAIDAARLRERLPERAIHQRTGCRLHPSYWPAKIAWLRRTQPALRAASVRWVSPIDLVLGALLGEVSTSASLASGTGLYGLRRPGWDRGLLAELGLDRAALPPVADEPRRGLLPRWRRRWPGLAQAVWAAPIGDGAAANLGSGCFDPRRRALTIGTSSALRVTTPAPPARLPPSLWCYRSSGARFVVGGALSAGGNLHEWMLKTLRVDDQRLPAPPERLTFLPLLAGERSPGFALRASGAVSGLTLATTPAELLAAGLESVAIQLACIDRDLDRVLPAPELVVASGTALLSNPGWMRMVCDALGRPLAPSQALEASSHGAALTALEAAGRAAAGRAASPGLGPRLRPSTDPAVRRHYAGAMARQTSLYRLLVDGPRS